VKVPPGKRWESTCPVEQAVERRIVGLRWVLLQSFYSEMKRSRENGA
jgi:hypothetical protein